MYWNSVSSNFLTARSSRNIARSSAKHLSSDVFCDSVHIKFMANTVVRRTIRLCEGRRIRRARPDPKITRKLRVRKPNETQRVYFCFLRKRFREIFWSRVIVDSNWSQSVTKKKFGDNYIVLNAYVSQQGDKRFIRNSLRSFYWFTFFFCWRTSKTCSTRDNRDGRTTSEYHAHEPVATRLLTRNTPRPGA